MSESNSRQPRVVIVPCSGIGKTYGTVSREAAYELTENIRPESTQLITLSLLVLGNEEAQDAVVNSKAVTIDGCKLACATKMVEQCGGDIAAEFAVLDIYRKHRKLKPRGIAELNQSGMQLAEVLANEVADIVDELDQSDASSNVTNFEEGESDG